MPSTYPFCIQENAPGALVGASCSRYIAVPVSLRNERDELMRCAVSNAKCALEELKRSKKHRKRCSEVTFLMMS